MRELVGKIPTKDPNITEVVYLSEMPVGIEVVTVERNDDSKKVIRRVCYCRGHGFGYETKAQSLPIRPHAQSEMPVLRVDNPAWHDLNSKANQSANVC